MATTTESLTKAIGKKSSLAFAWLADLHLSSGSIDEAVQVVDAGLERYPDFVPGLIVKAKILRAQNRTNETESLLVQVLETDPMNLAAQKSLALLYIEQKKGMEASVLVQSIKELDSLDFAIPEVPAYMMGESGGPMLRKAGGLPQSASEMFIEQDALFASMDDAFLDSDDETDEKTPADLQKELDNALSATTAQETAPEYFPADDPSVPGGTVSSLITSMFGQEDANSKPETPAEPAESEAAVEPGVVPVSETPVPNSLFASFAEAQTKLVIDQDTSNSLFEKSGSSADKEPFQFTQDTSSHELFSASESPISAPATPKGGGLDLASALDELFGDEDELPAENFANYTAGQSTFSEDAAPIPPSSDPDLSQGVSDALGDLFGLQEDDVPEEQDDLTREPEAEVISTEPAEEVDAEVIPSNDMRAGVSDALGDLFGLQNDENSEEHAESAAEPKLESLAIEPGEEVDAETVASELIEESGRDFSTALHGYLSGDEDEEEPTRGATTMDEILGGPTDGFSDYIADSVQTHSIMEDLFTSTEDPIEHDEGAILGGDLAASLIDDPNAPLQATTEPELPTPVVPRREDDDSFSGGMSNALSDLFGAELEEDLSDLFSDNKNESTPTSTKTLGELYLSQGHPREALQVFLELEAHEPGDPENLAKIDEIQKLIDSEDEKLS